MTTMPFAMPYATLPDAKIHYDFTGPANAQVVVFSNGLGTTMRMWDAQVEAFSKHFRVLRTDTRGHGQSSATPGPYSIEQLGRDVLHVLDSLQIDRAYFCGLSMGGMIGMWLGKNAPQRFHKIVLCNTAARIGTAESWDTRIETVERGGMKAVSTGGVERWLSANYRAKHPAETQALLAMMESANVAGYTACRAALREADFRNDVAQISVPCLAVAGTHDPTCVPADLQFLAKTIPGASYVELDAAHGSSIEAPEEFNRQVLQFLLA
jgi:3-oxoadipate enol-lactonase